MLEDAEGEGDGDEFKEEEFREGLRVVEGFEEFREGFREFREFGRSEVVKGIFEAKAFQ